MKPLPPAIGERFGRLVVIDNATKRGRDRAAVVACDCGATTQVTLSNLRRGASRSCGCRRYENAPSHPIQPLAPRIVPGDRFGRLVVESVGGRSARGAVTAVLLCDCGALKTTALSHLRSGSVRSCGCLQAEARRSSASTHGYARVDARAPEYEIWLGIIARCESPSDTSFRRYGARGIRICAEWRRDFPAFLAHVGRRPSDAHSIDRIDTNGNYEPGNVRWATAQQQARNMRTNHRITHNGATHCLAEWAEITGIRRETIAMRLRLGWTPAEALTTPVRRTEVAA